MCELISRSTSLGIGSQGAPLLRAHQGSAQLFGAGVGEGDGQEGQPLFAALPIREYHRILAGLCLGGRFHRIVGIFHAPVSPVDLHMQNRQPPVYAAAALAASSILARPPAR